MLKFTLILYRNIIGVNLSINNCIIIFFVVWVLYSISFLFIIVPINIIRMYMNVIYIDDISNNKIVVSVSIEFIMNIVKYVLAKNIGNGGSPLILSKFAAAVIVVLVSIF